MNNILSLFSMMFLFSCSIEQLEDGAYSCLLSSESNFGDGLVSCVDLEAPKFGEFAAEQACNDWDGAYVEGVHCETVKDQLGCQYPQTIAGFQITAIAWYKFSTGSEQAQIMDLACQDQQGITVKAK